MFLSVTSRVLTGIGITCFCFALAIEVQAQSGWNYYCWQTAQAACQYHACRCETGTTVFGCTESLAGEPTGWCSNGTTKLCLIGVEACGDKVQYAGLYGCSSCDDSGVEQEEKCNQVHNCLDNGGE